MTDDSKREVDLTIELEAEPERVWTAISDAEELRRWFPLEAEVEPGVGGSIRLSWGPDVEGTAPITVWEPGHRLGWAEEWPMGDEREPVRVAVDFRIESEGGVTRLRVVQSGFSADDSWDDYLDTLDSGWAYFLFNLKHYLERHPGRERTMVWDRRKLAGPKKEVWPRLLALYGLDADGAAPGDTARLWQLTGAEVALVREPIHLALRVPDLDDALLFLELEPGGDTFSLGTWLSLYGDAGRRATELETRLQEAYAGALPPATDG